MRYTLKERLEHIKESLVLLGEYKQQIPWKHMSVIIDALDTEYEAVFTSLVAAGDTEVLQEHEQWAKEMKTKFETQLVNVVFPAAKIDSLWSSNHPEDAVVDPADQAKEEEIHKHTIEYIKYSLDYIKENTSR